ncbi:glycosyltransferase, partial [Georgenia subflava]
PADAAARPADAARRTDATARTADAPLSVIFFGLFTPLQGTPVIGEAIRILHRRGAPVRFTLVGSGQDAETVHELVDGLDTVSWTDWVRGAELPALVAEHDVSLGIFATTPKALRVIPNKVYQGAAAGTAVVTSDTAPQRRVLHEAAILVPPGDPVALADALERLADDGGRLRHHRALTADLADAAFTPASVVRPILARLRTP